MPGIHRLTQHILAVADRYQTPITNFQLQKIMFFAIGMHIREVGRVDQFARDTYDKPFMKGLLGPISLSEFYHYSRYKEGDILDKGMYMDRYSKWDDTISKLCLIDAFSLSKIALGFPSWDGQGEYIRKYPHEVSYTLDEIHHDFNQEKKRPS